MSWIKKYKDGGPGPEEEKFQKFFKTLPSNLRVDDPNYNLRGYWQSLGKPEAFDYSQPKQDDGFYHAFSRNPETGEMLKGPQHHTFKMAIDEDRKAGYFPIVTPEGKIKTVSGNDLKPGQSVYAQGGDISLPNVYPNQNFYTFENGGIMNNKYLSMLTNPKQAPVLFPRMEKGGGKGKKSKPQPVQSDYIDLQKTYGLDPFSKEGIEKARQLTKKYPNTKILCTAAGCSEIAANAAEAYGYDFNRGNAWDLGNKNEVIATNPEYSQYIGKGILPDPVRFSSPKSVYGHAGAIIGLNRANNLVGNRATNTSEANDSYDYANQTLYPKSRGYEHVGFMLDDNTMLHGTAATAEHPTYYVIDNDMSNGVQLGAKFHYQPVEAITPEPSFMSKLGKWFGFENGGTNWLHKYADGGYTVKAGDTLSKISKQTGIPIAQLAKLNNIQDINKISVNQRLILPDSSAPSKNKQVVPYAVQPAAPQPINPFPAVGGKKVMPTGNAPVGVYANNQQIVKGVWPYLDQQPTSKKTPKQLPNKKQDTSGMDAIRAFNANNPDAIPYQDNQQAQLNPKKTKHTIKDLRASIANIPQSSSYGLPLNVSNYLKNHFSPNANMSVTNSNLSEEQQNILLQTIKNAQKRNKGALSGGADYADYPTTIGQSAQGFMNNPERMGDYLTTPEGQLATTLGGFTYNQDPRTGEYIVTDKYNFSNARNESRKNKKGLGLMGTLRKTADEDEAQNLPGESDSYWGSAANRRVGIILNPAEMKKAQEQKVVQNSQTVPSVIYGSGSMFRYGGVPNNWLNNYK